MNKFCNNIALVEELLLDEVKRVTKLDNVTLDTIIPACVTKEEAVSLWCNLNYCFNIKHTIPQKDLIQFTISNNSVFSLFYVLLWELGYYEGEEL